MAHRKLIISLDKDSINNPPIVLRQGESGLQAYDIEFMLDGTTLVIKDTDVVSFRGTTPAETYVSELCTVKSGLVTFTPKAATSAVGNYKIAYFSVNDIFGSGNNINVNVLEQADATAEQADVYVGEVTKLINDLTIKTSATIKDLTDKSAAAIKQLTDEQTALNTKIDTGNKTLTDNIAASQKTINDSIVAAEKALTDKVTAAQKALDTSVSTANKTLTDAMGLIKNDVTAANATMAQLKKDLAASTIQKYKMTSDTGAYKWDLNSTIDVDAELKKDLHATGLIFINAANPFVSNSLVGSHFHGVVVSLAYADSGYLIGTDDNGDVWTRKYSKPSWKPWVKLATTTTLNSYQPKINDSGWVKLTAQNGAVLNGSYTEAPLITSYRIIGNRLTIRINVTGVGEGIVFTTLPAAARPKIIQNGMVKINGGFPPIAVLISINGAMIIQSNGSWSNTKYAYGEFSILLD